MFASFSLLSSILSTFLTLHYLQLILMANIQQLETQSVKTIVQYLAIGRVGVQF